MRTKTQKEAKIKEVKEALKESRGVILIGFNGVTVDDINDFRNKVVETGARLRVVKRKLLDIAFENEGMSLRTEKFIGQIGIITFTGELSDIAGTAFGFVKDRDAKVFGGYDLEEMAQIDSKYLERIGQLPSREVLLAQVMGAFVAPLTGVMVALKEYAKIKK